MGNILSKIADDISDYELLCKYYNEKAQWAKDYYGNSNPDCYGKHAKELKERYSKEHK